MSDRDDIFEVGGVVVHVVGGAAVDDCESLGWFVGEGEFANDGRWMNRGRRGRTTN